MRSLKDLNSDFGNAKAALQKLHERELPTIMGVEAVKLVRENFTEQGYENGEGKEDWQPRPEWVNKVYDTNPAYKGSYIKGSNPIAKQTGKLFRSIQHQETTNKTFVGVNTNLVPYAPKINEGGTSYWAEIGRSINVIARKFLPVPGEPINPKLIATSKRKYEQRLDRVMQRFKK